MAGDPKMLERALSDDADRMLRRDLGPVSVCILDSGVDAGHPELAGRVDRAESMVPDGDAITPCEMRPGENNDCLGHGTAAASIVARLAPNARIVDIRIMDPGQSIRGEALLSGLERAIELEAQVINISLAASSSLAHPLSRLCDVAYRKGLVVVAAKRNLPLTDQGFPGEFASCVGVDRGSFRRPMDILYRPGEAIEYAARGENVEVAAMGGGWTSQSGSSFAAPAVSALCAVLLGAYPGLKPFEIKTLLKRYSEATRHVQAEDKH